MTIFGFPLAWPIPEERHFRFRIQESFFGVEGKDVEVTSGLGNGDCGINFGEGRTYLVYAHRDPKTKRLYVGICSRTQPLITAADDLVYLRSLSTSAPPGRIYGAIIRDGETTKPLDHVPVHLTWAKRVVNTVTDGGGNYDFPGLSAGTFTLSAGMPQNLGGGEPRSITLHENACSQQILVPFERIAPGDYYLGVNVTWPPSVREPWPPTYYPGVPDRDLATIIHVGSAQQLQGFELQLPPRLKERKITGVVTRANGWPAYATVWLNDTGFDDGGVALVNSPIFGRFSITGLEGRRYTIAAEANDKQRATARKVDLGTGFNGPVRLVLSDPPRK
jgi:hypothetical protein